MSNFRNEDFVYYALKAKPITKKPKKSSNVAKIVKASASPCEPLHHTSRKAISCLKPVDLVNKSLPTSKFPSKSKISHPKYQVSLIEMQKAVREQENMYRRFCHLDLRLSDDECNEFSPIHYESSSLKASNPANYFLSLLEDPKDNEIILFLEHAT
jgi:hypothetical protein